MRIEHEVLELRTKHTFAIARMKDLPVRRSVWVRLVDDDGAEGWGEAPVSTPYYGETADTVVAVLPRLASALNAAVARVREGAPAAGVGDVAWLPLEAAEAALDAEIGANRAAKAAVSSALHDLQGKRLGQPVWALWGLDPAEAPRSSFTIALDEPEAMRERVREAASYPILKIKIGTPRDEEILGLIRDEAPDVELKVDANTGWTAKEAIARLPMLEAYDVAMIEQPFAPDDLAAFDLLRRESSIPVYADESCRTLADVARLVGRVDGINIKLAKCGSLLEARRMVHAARAHGLGVMLGCMVESTLGIAAGVQLAPLMDHLDLDGAALLAEDWFDGPGIGGDGGVRFNGGAGLGVERLRR